MSRERRACLHDIDNSSWKSNSWNLPRRHHLRCNQAEWWIFISSPALEWPLWMEIWWQIRAWGWRLVLNLGPHKIVTHHFDAYLTFHRWYPTIHWLYHTDSQNLNLNALNIHLLWTLNACTVTCHIFPVPSYSCAECSPQYKGMPCFQSEVTSNTKGSLPRRLTRRINAISVFIFCYGLHRSMQDISSLILHHLVISYCC